jgi:hypothetical protein
MEPKNATFQPDLFEANEPPMMPAPLQKEQLAKLVEALFLEIAAVLAAGEASDEQDHG